MDSNPTTRFFTRREVLLTVAGLGGTALAARFFPATIVRTAAAAWPQQGTPADQVAAMRAQFGGAPI
jgi:hypothetical protein